MLFSRASSSKVVVTCHNFEKISSFNTFIFEMKRPGAHQILANNMIVYLGCRVKYDRIALRSASSLLLNGKVKYLLRHTEPFSVVLPVNHQVVATICTPEYVSNFSSFARPQISGK